MPSVTPSAAPSASAPVGTTAAPPRVEPPAPAPVGGTTASMPYVAPPPVTTPASAAAPEETTASEPVTEAPPAPPLVGGDRDAHGCIGSAGYSWCEAKQKCLRPWEEKCE